MTQLTKNFWRHEMRCRSTCGLDTIDYETLTVVQECCDHFALVLGLKRVICDVTSAHRCEAHNRRVGGSPRSQHLHGRALDFRIRGISPRRTYDYLCHKYPGKYGIGRYRTFTHLDTRSGPAARWDFS